MAKASNVPGDGAAATVFPYVIRPGRSSVRTTFKLAAEIPVDDIGTAERVFSDAAKIVLDWLAAKFPQRLPPEEGRLESFELDHHGQQQLLAIAIPERGLWSARLLQPDAPFKNRPAVAGRTWTTEAALARADDRIRFGIRVLCASAPYATDPITLTRPRVVLELARKLGLQEVLPLDGRPWILANPDELPKLHSLLLDKRRTMPVVLLTQPDANKLPGKIAEYLLDHEFLARRTQGLAHVVCMPSAVAFDWSGIVGKVWSAYLGTVRTYRPGLDFDNDSPFAHPRVLAEGVVFWRYKGLEGEKAYASFLIDKLHEHAAKKIVEWGDCLFYADARSVRAALDRERLTRQLDEKRTRRSQLAALRAQIEELRKAHQAEVEALRAQLEELSEEANLAIEMGAEAERLREQAEREKRNLQIQNDALRVSFEQARQASADADVTIPDNYGDMPDWVEQYLPGRLILHPRALHGLKKASFEDVELVYRSLLLLAREYRNKRIGYDGAESAWNAAKKSLELRFGKSIARERAGEHGDTYFVRYPLGSGNRRFLEYHLRKGSAKDRRRCLAIYFFWDDETRQVVVGWLPSHLETRAT